MCIRDRHRDEINEHIRKYRAAHKDKILEQQRKYYVEQKRKKDKKSVSLIT